MSQKIKLKSGKKTSLPTTESQPTALTEISALYGASPEVLQPVSDATQYNLNIGPGQLTFKPYVDINHTWRCGVLDIKYGNFTVSNSGVLIIDDTVNGTGKLIV